MSLAPARDMPSATVALEDVVRRIEVWPGCVHGLTRAEAAVIASPPFQRLRRLRQMGLAFHAWPNAENTRASHSLGVAYWAGAYLDALEESRDATTQAALTASAAPLGDLSLSLVTRLYALLHDIDLLPLGHTLRYQSGLFAEPPGRPRLAACVAAIQAHAQVHAFHDAATPDDRDAWLASLTRHLAAAAEILAGARTPAAHLVEELVNSGLGADLVDFALRDSAAITRPQAQHDSILDGLCLVDTDAGPGLALATDDDTATRRVAIADDLYRARFEVFAGSVYHPVKLAADAMLDAVLRRLGPQATRDLLPEDRILAMGDDELLDTLAAADRLAADLRDGALHAEAWRTDDLGAFRRQPDAAVALSLDPAWRTSAEQQLRARLPWAQDGDLIVAISAPSMQAKPANARLRTPDGVFALADAADHGHAVRAPETARRYASLWSLRVYAGPRIAGRTADAAAAAQALFTGAAP